MSTRSYILKEIKKDEYVGAYCHWDGYPEGVGATLVEHYQDADKVAKLISLGSMSCLEKNIEPEEGEEHSFDHPAKNVTVYYGRDRGETGDAIKPKKFKNMNSAIGYAKGCWCEFVYLFTQEGVWKFIPTYEKDHDNWTNLREYLDEQGVI